jgi:hypothetical protein
MIQGHTPLTQKMKMAHSIGVVGQLDPPEQHHHKKIVHVAITKVTKVYSFEKEEAQKTINVLEPGRLKSIIEQFENEAKLQDGNIPLETVQSRHKHNNFSGFAWQKVLPLEEVEPLLVQYCRKLANVRSPLCRDQVIGLMESLIHRTGH